MCGRSSWGGWIIAAFALAFGFQPLQLLCKLHIAGRMHTASAVKKWQ
jgi:hypothetical protein